MVPREREEEEEEEEENDAEQPTVTAVVDQSALEIVVEAVELSDSVVEPVPAVPGGFSVPATKMSEESVEEEEPI